MEHKDWDSYFQKVFDGIRTEAHKRYPSDNKDEVSPNQLALKNALVNFSCSIKLIELKLDSGKFLTAKNGYLIKYDLATFGNYSVEFLGAADINNPAVLIIRLQEGFGFSADDAIGFAKDLCQGQRITASFFEEIFIQVAFYDIQKDIDKYVSDLFILFTFSSPVVEWAIKKFKASEDIDYNTLYNLSPDPILPSEKFLQIDSTLSGFMRLRTGQPSILEDLQRDVCSIQLIPTVPEKVKKVFQMAKKLYILGYFDYSIFTVSQHYTYLAIESAIKNKYNHLLGEKAVLENKKGEQHIISAPSYEDILDFCYQRKGWSPREIKVNGEKFPSSFSLLVDWFVERNVIKKWRGELLMAGLDLRNSLSHLESPKVLCPSSQILKVVADDINHLYHEPQ